MKKFARFVLTMALAAVIVAPLAAGEKDKKKKKNKKPRKARVAQLIRFPKAVQESLTDDQKKQIQAINAEYAPKIGELAKKQREVLTPEKQKAAREALQAARKAGKKGKELRQAFEDALGLSAEQKKELAEINKQRGSLFREAREKATKVLTDEQKAKLRPAGKKGGKKGAKKRKKKNADK